MRARPDTVLDLDGTILFHGSTHEAVRFLEDADPFGLWWVSIGETGDLISASQYLDLAS